MSDQTIAITVTDEQQAWLTGLVEKWPYIGYNPDAERWHVLARNVYDALPVSDE